jgi:hypothetical protein
MANSDAPSSVPATESPWFWVMLFSLAGLAALFTIGPKFERREQGIETKFHARERGLGREAAEPPSDDAPAEVPQWEPIFTIGPIAAVLAAIAALSMYKVAQLHRLRFAQQQTVETNSKSDPRA